MNRLPYCCANVRCTLAPKSVAISRYHQPATPLFPQKPISHVNWSRDSKYTCTYAHISSIAISERTYTYNFLISVVRITVPQHHKGHHDVEEVARLLLLPTLRLPAWEEVYVWHEYLYVTRSLCLHIISKCIDIQCIYTDV